MYSMDMKKIGRVKYQLDPSVSSKKKFATIKMNEISMLQKEELWVSVYHVSRTMHPNNRQYPA